MSDHISIFDDEFDGPDAIVDGLVQKLASQGMSAEEISRHLESKTPEIVKEMGAVYADGIRRQMSEVLADHQDMHTRFSRRLRKKWREPFSLLRMLISLVREAGEEFNKTYRLQAVEEKDLAFEALVRLHVRSCLIAEEISCLLENGFASGSHSRWRTLYELVVVSYFIENMGNDVAERYLLHHVVESARAAVTYQKHCETLDEPPFSEDEMDEFRDNRDELIRRFGRGYGATWGWASEALDKSNPTFADIESAVDMDHMRPYFTMSCHPNHAGSKGMWFDLGLKLAPTHSSGTIAGPSDAGLSEPGRAVAHSLMAISINLLLHGDPSMTRIVTGEVIRLISEETQTAFSNAESELEVRAAKINERITKWRERK